jgi:hypothetical protein
MKISPKLAFFAVVSTLAYLALAIWGLGGFAAYFSHGSLVVIALVTLIMAVVSLFTEVNLSSGEREDRANRWVIPAFGVIGLLSGFVPAYTDRIDFWTFGGEGVRWLGALLFIVGGALRLWPVFVLGKRFSGLVAIQPGHRLVTEGIYRNLQQPQLPGDDGHRHGLGTGLSFGGRADIGGADADPADRAHSLRRGLAQGAVR